MKKNILFIVIFVLVFITGCGKIEFYCEQGELIDNKCKFTEIVDATITCPTGYTFNTEKGKCVSSMSIAAKTVNTCAKGYVIGNEKWCFSEIKYDMIVSRSCKSDKIKEGDTLSSTYVSKANLCYEKICVEKSEDGTTCLKYEENNIPYTVSKDCPKSGMIKLDGFCRKISWLNIETSCEVGELVDGRCVIENLADASISCNEGYSLIDGYKCQKITYSMPKEK